MIQVSHVDLPPGLNALARRDPDGELIVLVSRALSADRQRAAVRTALRAAKRADRRAAVLPLPVAGLLAATGLWFRGLLRGLRAHWALTAAVAATAVAAVAVYAVAVPHGHQPASAARGPGTSRVHGSVPGPSASRGQPSRHAGPAGSSSSPRASSGGSTRPTQQSTQPGQQRSPGSSPSPHPQPSSSPAPSPSPSSSKPAPSPSPSPSPSSSGKCVIILGIWVCL